MKNPIVYLSLISVLLACNPKTTEQKTTESMKPENERMVLYQMFTRLFGNTNTTNKPWGTIEENGVGKFNDVSPKALEELSKMGFTHIWYTGVIEHAVLTDYTEYGIPLNDADVVKGRAGSPYAIKDYYDVNPDLAVMVEDRIKEFEALVIRTHEAGMKVLIDFVPNHVAREYHSDMKPEGVFDFGEDDDPVKAFDPNNNFYYILGEAFQVPADYNSLGDNDFPTKDGKFDENPAKATGNDVFSASPSVNDWFETVKLNYGVDYLNNRTKHFEEIPDTWKKMKDILLYWAAKDVDGFRCDMAEMVPVEFWEWVIKEVKTQYPDITFTAEIYNPDAYRDYIFTGGFDYLYDKVEMYDTLKHIIQNTNRTDGITGIWQRQDGIGPNMLRFLENHDEQRITSPDFAGDMWKGIPMMAATAFLHTGPVMMYFGQEVGEPGKGDSGFAGDDGRTTIFDYWSVAEHVKWVNGRQFDGGQLSGEQKQLRQAYIDILKATNEQEAIREGQFYDLHYYNRNEQYTGYSDKVYTFVRHTKNQVLLIVINFAEESQTARIKAPEAAWVTFGFEGKETAQVDGKTIKLKSTFGYDQESELVVEMKPMSYRLIEVK
jgi:glycosidase